MVALGILIWLVPYCAFNWAYYHQLIPSYATAYNLSLPSGLEVDSTHLLSIETVVHWIKSLFSLLPNTGLLLFSSEVGLVYSNPILPIGFIAFLWFLSRGGGLNNWRVGVMIAALVFSYYSFSVAIVLLWKTTASDYGYRYLFPLIPVALLFTAVMLKGIEGASLTKKTIVKSTIVVLSLIGTINVFFYKVTPLLSPMEQENVYGEWHGSSLRDYEVNLVKELTNYRTFVLAGGKSYLGFLAAPYFLDTGLVEIIPPSIREKFVPRFRDVPSVIYIQTGMLALLWVGFGWFWNQKSRRSDETNHSTSLL